MKILKWQRTLSSASGRRWSTPCMLKSQPWMLSSQLSSTAVSVLALFGQSLLEHQDSALWMKPCVAKLKPFGYGTASDFGFPSHRRELLRMLDDEMPDEIYLEPRCSLLSTMQSISATTPERQAELQRLRQEHHDVHLKFCRKICLKQVNGARHAHLEQTPCRQLSWQADALKGLAGHKAVFDQCRYGATCLDSDGYWKLVKKSTQVLTTKQTLAQALHLRCDGSHEHCHLEGHMMGGRLRTSYMEDCQPAMATVIATALAKQPAG